MRLRLYKIYKYLTGNKPIYHVITSDENELPAIVKEHVKFKSTPMEGDRLYFKDIGPYYRVIGVAHHIDILHVIWVSVKKIN